MYGKQGILQQPPDHHLIMAALHFLTANSHKSL